MLGFNWVDLIIILILANAIYNGLRIGFIALVFGFGGFFIALFSAGWLFPHILPLKDSTVLSIVNSNLVLVSAVIIGIFCFERGKQVHVSLADKKWLHRTESAAGITLSLSSALVIVWLIAAGIGALPFAGLSNSATDSFIVQKMDLVLPAAPAVFEEFTHYINPNAPVKVYSKLAKNSSIGIAPKPSVIPSAINDASSRVVRITSFGCGGIVGGSGFIAAPGLVATNAHVIAGVHRPIVKIGNSSYAAVPVSFDPNQDIALLRIAGLKLAPLPLAAKQLLAGSSVFIESYPQSIYTITKGAVINDLPTIGSNIYGLGDITRPSYTLQASITNGSSGGALLSASGEVEGIMFADDSTQHSVSYALTTQPLISAIKRVADSDKRVGTGSCYE